MLDSYLPRFLNKFNPFVFICAWYKFNASLALKVVERALDNWSNYNTKSKEKDSFIVLLETYTVSGLSFSFFPLLFPFLLSQPLESSFLSCSHEDVFVSTVS